MATVNALLTTALAGDDNDLVWTAVSPGPVGNRITVRYVNPGTVSAVESIDVSGLAITVNLATSGAAAITSTGDSIKATLLADVEASKLVTAADAAANDGSGLVIALAATNLATGAVDGTTLGYADQDDAEDDGWKYKGESPTGQFVYETLVNGVQYAAAGATANAALAAAMSQKERLLVNGYAQSISGPAAD